MMLGIIKRNFFGATEHYLLNLYKTMVRPHIEYPNQVWHPRRLQDVDKLERVQTKATKIIIRGKKLTYENRLRKLKLPTLTYRQVRGDMIDVYKFLSGKYDKNCSVKLQLYSCRGSLSGVETRGNSYKLVPDRSKYELRRHYFSIFT